MNQLKVVTHAMRFIPCLVAVLQKDNEVRDNKVVKVNESCNKVHPTTHQFGNLSVEEIYKKWKKELLVQDQ